MSFFIKKYIILTSTWVIVSTLTFNLCLSQYLSSTVYFVPFVFGLWVILQAEKKYYASMGHFAG